MLHFFKRLRHNLVFRNKLSKYLLYASGEIILVVIGILIALTINNWNERRLQKIEEHKSLTSLLSEMNENLKLFDNTHIKHKNRNDAIDKILFSNVEKYSLYEIDSLYITANFNWTYNPSFSIYNALINSGKIQLLENDLLKNRISQFKDLVFDYIEDEMFIFNFSADYTMIHFLDDEAMLVETKFGLRPRTEQEASIAKENYLKEFQSPDYRNRLSIVILNGRPLIETGKELRLEMVYLIDMIKAEINQ